MAYIYIKKKGNKKYYYLRENIRKKDKVVPKDILYLGKDINKIKLNKNISEKSKKKIVQLRYLEGLKDEKIKENKFFKKDQLKEINSILSHYKKSIHHQTKKNLNEKIKIKLIFENTSLEYIEKNLANETEIKSIIKERIMPKNKSFIHVSKVINTNNILYFLEKEKPKINLKLIEKINKILLENIYRINGFRVQEIKILGNAFKPAPCKKIKPELKKLISWYNKNKTKIYPLALVILFHHKFEKIHPFLEGNGEVGRILINYQLHQLGYPPIILSRRTKEEYHKTMNKAYPCLKNNLLNTDMRYYSDLINFMHKQFVKTYWENFI